MSTRYNNSVLFLIATLCAGGTAVANDSSFGDRNGTIVLTEQPDIRMDKESLLLSEQRIEVEYVFTNTGKNDLTVSMAFPMPPMFFGDMDHNEITDFKLWVNDKPVKTTRKLVIRLDDETDITREVARLGWNEAELIKFLSQNEITLEKEPLPSKWFDERGEARFTLNEYFVWSQKFALGRPVKIRHVYTPSLSTGVPIPSGDLIEGFREKTCIDQSTIAGIKKREHEFGVFWSHLSYILVTADNWKGPIKDFHLTIKKRHPSDLISLCFHGNLKKTDALTFEFRAENFRPERDLDILFVRVGDER